MSPPLAQRRKEIIDVFLFGPEVAAQLSRVNGGNRALSQLQLLDRGVSVRRVLLLDRLCHICLVYLSVRADEPPPKKPWLPTQDTNRRTEQLNNRRTVLIVVLIPISRPARPESEACTSHPDRKSVV